MCTLNGVFQIRDNKLNFTVDMRSNDVFFGLTFDYPFFTILQQQMHTLLKKVYPDLELGTYTHIAHSLHMYERDFDKVEKMLENEFKPSSTPEIDCDLIDSTGNTTKEFDEVMNKVLVRPSNLASTSHIMRWLYGNATN